MKLPRRHPRAVYTVYEPGELADGATSSDPLEDVPGAFDRAAGALGQDTVSIDSDLRAAASVPGSSTGRVIGGVLIVAGVACAIAVLTIALLGMTGGGTATRTHSGGHRFDLRAARVPARRALRVPAPRRRERAAGVREGRAAKAPSRHEDLRATATIAPAAASSSGDVVPTPISPVLHPTCGCLIAEIEFGFER